MRFLLTPTYLWYPEVSAAQHVLTHSQHRPSAPKPACAAATPSSCSLRRERLACRSGSGSRWDGCSGLWRRVRRTLYAIWCCCWADLYSFAQAWNSGKCVVQGIEGLFAESLATVFMLFAWCAGLVATLCFSRSAVMTSDLKFAGKTLGVAGQRAASADPSLVSHHNNLDFWQEESTFTFRP
jgi:hypothetical protein